MTRRFRTLAAWLLVTVLVLLLATLAALMVARDAWQQWLASQSIQTLEWQGLQLSWPGLELSGFTLVRSGDGQSLSVRGSGLRVGWSWTGLALNRVRIEQLELEVPDWPEQGGGGSALSLPASVPDWVPEQIVVEQIHVSLPEKTRVQGDLSLTLGPDPTVWQLHSSALHLHGQLPELESGGWRVQGIQGQLTLSATVGVDSAEIALLPGSVLEAVRIENPGQPDMPALDQLQADLSGLGIRAGYRPDGPELQSLTVTGPVQLSAGALHHSLLKTLGWSFQGTASGSPESVTVNGRLTGTSGIAADLALGWSDSGNIWLDGGLQLTGSQAGTVLAATLVSWPETLQLEAGSLKLGGHLHWNGDDLLADASLVTEGLSGILDRTAWSGVTGRLDVSYGDKLVARTWDMQLASLNPGMELGPVTLSASYEAPVQAPDAGVLTLTEGRAGLFGGEAWVRPGQWPVTSLPVQLQVELNDVQLERLLQAYPAEGVYARGTLEGSLPLQLGRDGVLVQGGSIQALAPGGVLQLPAGQIQAMMGNSVSVAPVVQALQNFNYTALVSTIDYDLDGRLDMGLRLQGRNPEVEDGRPIVLNIHLEEDIPALLTSLQLSGRVNEAVTERVRSMMNRGESGQSGQ